MCDVDAHYCKVMKMLEHIDSKTRHDKKVVKSKKLKSKPYAFGG